MPLRYFGFYWTRPVPWIPFNELSDDIEVAVTESRTILFSRAVVQAYVREQGGILMKEVARMELRPDRGTREFGDEFAALLDEADRESARVAVVDFSAHYRVRRNAEMEKHYGADPHRYDKIPVHPDEPRAGVDPFRNFRWWELRQRAHTDGKAARARVLIEKLEEMEGMTLAERAYNLNEAGLRTLNGKEWTAVNLRGFARSNWLY